MFKTLYARLAVVLALLLVAVGTVVAGFAVQATGLFLQELEQRFNRDLARQLLVQRDLVGVKWLNATSVKELFSHYMHVNPAIEIYLLDTQGNILAYEAPQMRIKRQRVDVEPIRRFLADATLPVLGDDPRDETRRKVFSAAAFPFDGPPRQYLYVVLGGEAFDSVRSLLRDSYLARFSLTAIAGVVLFSVLAGAVAFHLLTRRLRRLAAAMDAFRHSGLHAHERYAGSGGDDEIDRLGATFNHMAQRIGEQVAALEAKDSLRRNLVANVSHDLRTPLAALQGYIETLRLKADELPAEERQRYLDIAYRQSERLTRLVSELFELSKLDATETLPAPEPAAIGELLADLAQKFRLRAEERGIRIEMHIAPGLPLVPADVAMMDRVLGNLLENAVTHTPDGGTITLAAERVERGVQVAVSNSGPPIDPANLPHLFERYYQAPERRGRGAGLGLAIVKRILDLHGAAIRVDSGPDTPTTFAFTLPG
jgi:two-component system OmpR family sensor kinase